MLVYEKWYREKPITALILKRRTPVTEMVTWRYYQGFQGVECYHCKAKYNILIPCPGILCERCGKFVAVSWSHHQMTFDFPDFGPSRPGTRHAMWLYLPFEMWKYFGMVDWDHIEWEPFMSPQLAF
jgi:hypothetical protein